MNHTEQLSRELIWLRKYWADTREGTKVENTCLDVKLTCELLDAYSAPLRQALEKLVWRDRAQFPDDPYCVLCGAGRKFAAEHGHQPTCLLGHSQEEGNG
jgi:hypothetical protein